MDVLAIILRILHTIAGVFWLGSAMFWLLFLRPQLRRLGPAIERPVETAVDKATGPAFGISSLVLVGTGVALSLKLRWGHLDTFFTTAWG